MTRTSRRSISSRPRRSSATLPTSAASRSGEPLSKATLYATLSALKRFFIWLAGQPGYKSRISYSDAEYFNLSAKETRIAKATRPARVPTLEQIRHVIRSMPATTDIERRDRALIAFTILTGARDGAIASFKLRHIDIAEGKIDQDAREVQTKFSKSFVTTFFPVGDDIRAVVADWVSLSADGKALGAGRSAVSGDQGRGGRQSPVRGGGSGPQALEQRRSDQDRYSRKRSRRRDCRTSTRTASGRRWRFSGDKLCRTPEEYKAWSQNLGHEHVLTTFCSYGDVSSYRQAEIMRSFAGAPVSGQDQ